MKNNNNQHISQRNIVNEHEEDNSITSDLEHSNADDDWLVKIDCQKDKRSTAFFY